MLTVPLAAPAFTPSRADRWRIWICAVLIALNVGQYVLLLAGIPTFYERIATGTVPNVVVGGQIAISETSILIDAAVRGMTPRTYAVYFIVLNLVVAAGFWAAAALVLAKAGGHWFRWLTALFLIFFPSGQLWPITQVSQVNYKILSFAGLLWPMFLLFFYLFPDGRAVPRWSRWPVAGFVLIHLVFQVIGVVAEQMGAAFNAPEGILGLFGVVVLFGLLFALGCQVYRYLRVAGPVERKQMQWFVAMLAFLVFSSVLYQIVTGDGDLTSADGYASDLDLLFGLIIPAAITISILRYRLWDIDLIIRRTLVYGVLSGLLALVYFGSVVVLEGLLRGLTGGSSQVAIVLSTLLIAALFVPVRGRVQALIDRRFFRRKYDAASTLAVFGASVRDNVDLDALGAHLTAVVDETMQPAHVGLWAPPEARRRPHDAAP